MKQKHSLMKAIYESWIRNSDNVKEQDLWIEYLSFLVKTFKDQKEAQRVYE